VLRDASITSLAQQAAERKREEPANTPAWK
jgi:hypothetical protein